MNENELPPLRHPELTPQRTVLDMPQISGEAFQHVGRYAGAIVLSCFEQIGGLQRMAHWADSNPTDFYTKLFPKMIQRSAQVDVSGHVTIDDAISNLERNTVEGKWTEVPEVRELPASADYVGFEDVQVYDL